MGINMKQYVTATVKVDAWQLTQDNLANGIPRWIKYDNITKVGTPDNFSTMSLLMTLNTKTGNIYALEGSYIVHYGDGYIQVVPEEFFKQYYLELVD